jgi:hypothetical protein
MKKTLSTLLFLITFTAFSQADSTYVKHHEVKINAFNILIFKTIDLSYEYLINEESSVGVSLLFNLNDEDTDGPYYNETFAFTPFYRRYFSKKYAQGFFMEGFGMYNKQQSYYYEYDIAGPDGTVRSYTTDQKTDNFALGISLGAKFVSERGFAFEFLAGVGRNIFTSNNDYNTEFVPRFATSLGYRF